MYFTFEINENILYYNLSKREKDKIIPTFFGVIAQLDRATDS